MTVNEIMDMLMGTLHTTGIYHFQWNIVVMWGVGYLFIYLAIAVKIISKSVKRLEGNEAA